jgi:hypothetical protein
MSTATSPASLPANPPKPRSGAFVWLKRGAFGIIIAVVSLGGLGAVYQIIATRRDAQHFPPTGEMVDVGGYRLHMIVADASHANLVTSSEYLPAVTAAVQQVFEAARDGKSLQPSAGPLERQSLDV